MSNGHGRVSLDSHTHKCIYPVYDVWLEGPEPDVLLPGETSDISTDTHIYTWGEPLNQWCRRPTGRAAALAEREQARP